MFMQGGYCAISWPHLNLGRFTRSRPRQIHRRCTTPRQTLRTNHFLQHTSGRVRAGDMLWAGASAFFRWVCKHSKSERTLRAMTYRPCQVIRSMKITLSNFECLKMNMAPMASPQLPDSGPVSPLPCCFDDVYDKSPDFVVDSLLEAFDAA